jgi:anaerobic nitric oxide reductase transcription regulator
MRDALLEIAADLTASLSTEARYQRLIEAVQKVVPCDAAALLRLKNDELVPVAAVGLSPDVLGRTFAPKEHPRLARILGSREPVRFSSDDPRPDPYDGLVEAGAREWSRVHSCMGSSLFVGDELVGALTMDAVEADVRAVTGEIVVMPADVPHALRAARPSKMLLVMIR